MTEGLINLVDDDSSHDVHGGLESEHHAEQLPTSRFPSSGPSPTARRAFAPHAVHAGGPVGAPGPVGVVVPPARQSYPMGGNAPGGLYPSEPPAPLPRTSWWRSLIASTVSPGPDAAEEESADRRIGKTCLGMAFGFALLSLLVGLRAAPAEPPAVAVAIVTSRTIIALGLIAFGYAAMRVGERFFAPRAKGGESSPHSR
jgi:hypothetical protein